jgi:hypothetical protein
MRKDELMKSDLVSEIVLLGSCVATLILFATIVVTAVTHSVAIR